MGKLIVKEKQLLYKSDNTYKEFRLEDMEDTYFRNAVNKILEDGSYLETYDDVMELPEEDLVVYILKGEIARRTFISIYKGKETKIQELEKKLKDIQTELNKLKFN